MNTKITSRVLFTVGILLGCTGYVQALEIERDGNYISSERVSVEEGGVYELSGRFTLSGAANGPESYVQIGLIPYGEDGEALQSGNYFPNPLEGNEHGFILVDTVVIEKNAEFDFKRKIKLGGSELKSLAFVVGASLSEGAKLGVNNLKLVPIDELASEASASSGSATTSTAGANSEYTSSMSEVQSSVRPIDSDTAEGDREKILSKFANLRRIIYVNADFGSDNFEGLRRLRGQADGPKRTIKSALSAASDGDQVVLQESNKAYEVGTIKPKAGQTLVIRAEGKASIKAKK